MKLAGEPQGGSSRPQTNPTSRGTRSRLSMACWPLAWLGLHACVAPEAAPALPHTEVAAFSAQGKVPAASEWWKAFADPLLDARIEQGLAGNWTLRVAWERMQAARALARRERAARRLHLDAFADGVTYDGDDPLPDQELRAGLQASFEVDLWGRIGAQVQAADWEARATAEDFQAATISLTAEIATASYRWLEARAQRELVLSQLETNRNVQKVIQNRFAIGQSGSADVLRQRQLVEATEEQRLEADANVELLEHQLAVLLGYPPQEWRPQEAPQALPSLPPLPAIGLPSELLQRRPDVRAAFARLRSTDAAVAAAVKDRYPRLTLTASARTSGRTGSDLFSDWLGTLAGDLVGPLLDGAQRRREVDRNVALRRQSVAEYGEVVLQAFQEVEDLLVQEQWQAQRQATLAIQRDLARTTYTELRNQYMNGAGDFIDVLVALRDQQALERSWLQAQLLRIEVRIALHRAIAGSVSAQPPASSSSQAPSSPNQQPYSKQR